MLKQETSRQWLAVFQRHTLIGTTRRTTIAAMHVKHTFCDIWQYYNIINFDNICWNFFGPMSDLMNAYIIKSVSTVPACFHRWLSHVYRGWFSQGVVTGGLVTDVQGVLTGGSPGGLTLRQKRPRHLRHQSRKKWSWAKIWKLLPLSFRDRQLLTVFQFSPSHLKDLGSIVIFSDSAPPPLGRSPKAQLQALQWAPPCLLYYAPTSLTN